MARAALIVGIDYYLDKTLRLKNCVDDAYEMKNSLKYHSDDSANFECHLMTATSDLDRVDAAALSNAVREFFRQDAEVLFSISRGTAGRGSAERRCSQRPTTLSARDSPYRPFLTRRTARQPETESSFSTAVMRVDLMHTGNGPRLTTASRC